MNLVDGSILWLTVFFGWPTRKMLNPLFFLVDKKDQILDKKDNLIYKR